MFIIYYNGVVTEVEEKSNNSLYTKIAVGISAGFIGQYIGDVIYNFLENKGYTYEIRSEMSLYLAGIISGGVAAIFDDEIPLFQSVLLSVGIFYLVFDASDQFLGGDGMSKKIFLKEFIVDAIIIYILVTFQNTFIDLFLPNVNSNTNTLFDDEIILTLISGIIINSYYDVKKIITNKI